MSSNFAIEHGPQHFGLSKLLHYVLSHCNINMITRHVINGSFLSLDNNNILGITFQKHKAIYKTANKRINKTINKTMNKKINKTIGKQEQ